MIALERLSVEASRRCSKGCSFCYNGSGPDGDGAWTPGALAGFAKDCAAHGVKAVSFGGGEPLEYEGIHDVLRALAGVMFRSLTTSGLPLLDAGVFDALVASRPDKVHVSIHAPENGREVERVVAQVGALAARGVRSGVNLLVRRSRVEEARAATERLHAAGIGNERIVFLPMRGPGEDAPSDQDVARVAGGRFQAMTCLTGCGKSPRFASIASDRTAAWCSYTLTRRPLREATWAALVEALRGAEGVGELGLKPCGEGLVSLRRGPVPREA
jgi:organic radical activating enzyme